MRREKSNKINIYRISRTFSFNDLDFDGKNGFEKAFEDTTQKLYIRRSWGGIPAWLEYLKPIIGDDVQGIKNANSSFILIIKHNDSIYALSGGSGYSKLENFIEPEFGINIALRIIDEKRILALNQRSLKGSTRQIYRSVIGYDPLFDKGNFTRMLNAIEGKGEFEGKLFRISGKSSLMLRTTKDVAKLSEVLLDIEAIALREEKVHFPKSFETLKDEALIKELNVEMFKMVADYWKDIGDRERLYLEFKDALIQFRCTKFKGKFNRQEIELEDFDLDTIKQLFKERGIVEIKSIDELSKIDFSGFNEDGFEEFEDSLQNLLICEILKEGNTYLKVGKRWLRVLDEIQKFIDEEIKSVTILRELLPKWDSKQQSSELEYNKFVAENFKYECMDRKCIQIHKSKIELCDIFDQKGKRFFHIKETWGSKSAYLFTQGSTSAEFFVGSKEFRDKCKKQWPSIITDDYSGFEVVFGIASNKATENAFPLNMTFFAKLNLYNAISILKQIEYKTFLSPIKKV